MYLMHIYVPVCVIYIHICVKIAPGDKYCKKKFTAVRVACAVMCRLFFCN